MVRGLRASGAATLVFGLTLVYLVASGSYTSYVRPLMALPVLGAGLFLLALGAIDLAAQLRPGSRGADGHSHGGSGLGSAWLLVVPVLVVVLVGPPALGAYAASRAAPRPLQPPPSSGMVYAPLPAADVLEIPVDVYADRSSPAGEQTLQGRRFTITGFVTPAAAGGWYVTRMRVRCCAADARPVLVRAVHAPAQPADAWVSVTGSYAPAGPDNIAQLDVDTVTAAAAPAQPYVYG